MYIAEGLVIVVAGVAIILLRNVLGWSSEFARLLMTGKESTESQQKTSSFLPTVVGVGVVLLGIVWTGYGVAQAIAGN